MENKNILFTKHARGRIEERKISVDLIQKVINQDIPVIHQNQLLIKEYADIRVVFQEKGNTVTIVTVYKKDSSLEKKIEKIPHPLEWSSEEGKKEFINQAYHLKELGLDETIIMDLFIALYKATCKEFGQ